MKTWGGAVVIGGDNLPSPVGIGLNDLPNIGTVAPLAPLVPASLISGYHIQSSNFSLEHNA